MDKIIMKLGTIFRKMVRNYNSMGDSWKNIELGREAFGLMLSLPDTYPGEYETSADKANLLNQMLDHMVDSANDKALRMLRDYIDTSVTMEDFCKRYRRHLKFDPVERSEEYERAISEVERKIAKGLKGIPRGMGFCFAYWTAKKAELAKRAIEWNSPAYMNPGVMFD